MKIRKGFVSNSSSASFIVTWLIKEEKSLTTEEALKIIFEYDRREDLVEEISTNTTAMGDNYFETKFYTHMMNCPGDFGKEAEALMFVLHYTGVKHSKYIKLVSSVIIDES